MAVSLSAIARVTGVDVTYRNFNLGRAQFLPQRLAVIGQGNTASTYATTKFLANTAGEVGDAVGYGSPLHLAALQLFPANGDGIGGIPVTIYPLEDDGAAVTAAGSIECTGTATETTSFTIEVGGVPTDTILITSGDLADAALATVKTAINAVLEQPVIAGTVGVGTLPLTAKWGGESGNDISIDLTNAVAAGLTFSSTAFSSGATNPDITTATDQIGETWETMILNCLNYDDTTTLGLYVTFNEGRWLNTVKKPLVVASGCTDNFATRTAITDARKSDRTNFLITNVGSLELPFVVAARGLAKDIMPTANDNPPQNYKGKMTGVDAGADSAQENYTVRNNAVKLGSSTNLKEGSVAVLQDVVTFYHPVAEGAYPAYRYVVDIVKLQNVLYNVRLIFEADEWKGVPLLDDGTPTINPTAKQPKNAVTALSNLAKSLADNAIISDLAFTLEGITATINSQNPKRLDTTFPVKLSGNIEVSSNDIYFGFYLGA
jgi:phage tail sheath gpL-like